jgi:hypothetical protein
MGAEEVRVEVKLRESGALQLDGYEELVGDSAGARHRRRDGSLWGDLQGAGAQKEASMSWARPQLADVEWGRHGSAIR